MGERTGALRPRPWLVVLSVLLWSLITIGSWNLGQSYIDRFQSQRESAALAKASVAAEAVEQTLLRSVEAVESIQALTQTRADLLTEVNLNGADAIADHLRAIVRSEQFGVLQVSTIDRTGWMSWSTTPFQGRLWLGDREHFLVHRNGNKGLHISTPLIGRASMHWSVQFTHPIVDANGDFNGVSVVSYDPIKLSDTLAALSFGQNSVSAVLRIPDGQLIARSQDAEYQLGRPSEADHPAIVAARKSPSGTLQMTSRVTGRNMLAAYRIVGTLPLLVVIALDAKSELADVESLAWSVHLAVFSAPLLAALLLEVMAQRLAKQRSSAELDLARSKQESAEYARGHIARLLAGLPAAVYSAAVTESGEVRRFTLPDNVARLTGWPLSDLADRADWTSRVEAISAARWCAHYRSVIQNGDAAIEYCFRRPEGSTIWLRDQARVLHAHDPNNVEVVGYISDITQERSLQEQTVASAKLATLGEMAAGLAHELNQPIAIMSLAAENASRALATKGEAGIAFAVQRMNRIADQAGRARTIVDHLRIFGRKDEEKLGPVHLDSVVDGALTLVGSALREAGVTITVDVSADLPAVHARQILCEQVLVNLLLNARDAMETNESGAPRVITVVGSADPGSDQVVLNVTDTGPGIPAPVLARMFDPFFTTKAVGKGTGLGLSICHGIMRSFSGTIAAANSTGPGAIFTLGFQRAPSSRTISDSSAPEALEFQDT